jgi:hypothetical protein
MLAVFCYDAVRLERNGFSGLTLEEFSNVDSMDRSRVAARLDSCLLAHLGRRELLAPLRRGGGADLPWIVGQAVSSLLIDTAWVLDAAARFLTGRHWIGGTEYLFDSSFPLWVRLLSLFHVVIPFLLLWALHRVGYDRRGWLLQSVIAIPVLVFARLASTPKTNINFVYADPFFHRSWGPWPLHVLAVLAFLVFVVYLPTHLLLSRLLPSPRQD